MSDIDFFIPAGHIVPTDFWLNVHGTRVLYYKIPNGYRFTVFEPDADKAQSVVEAVINQMLFEHNEMEQHDIFWKTIDISTVESGWKGGHIFDWQYKVEAS